MEHAPRHDQRPAAGRRRVIAVIRRVVLGIVIVAAPVSGCRAPGRAALEEDRGRADLAEASVFLERGLTDSALAAFGLAIEENPKLVDAHMGMGHIYRERAQYDRASRAYLRATELHPTDFDAHYLLGLTYQLGGRLADAVTAYLRSLVIEPASFDANYHVASAYLQLGQPSVAAPYARRATDLNADHQAAWANLAAAYSLLGWYEKAIDAYREAAERGDLATPILVGFADARIHLGQYERAAVVLRQLVRRQPDALAHERLGYCHFKMRHFDQARASYEAALAHDARDTAALNGLGASLMTLYLQSGHKDRGQYDRAMSAWRQSVQLNLAQPRIIDLLARFQRR